MAVPTLALIPAAQGSKLYSVLPSNGVGDFDFTRASTATRVNSKGLIEEVASGVSRLDYTGGGCPHHLLEPQSTNKITRSEDIDYNWSKSNIDVVNNETISPYGTLNAGLVTANSVYGQHILYDSLIGSVDAGSDYFISCFVKKSTTRYIRLNEGYSGGTVFVDLDNDLTFSESGGASDNIIDNYGNGWLRVGFKFTAHSSGNSQFALYLNDNSNNNYYEGSGESVYLFGAQLEQGSYATSYIPTNGSTVTRLAETANGAGDASTFNDSEGVLMIETAALADSSDFRNFSLSDGTTSNLISFIFTNTNIIRLDFTNQAQLFDSNTDIKNNNKILLSYKLNEVKLYVNGFLKSIDTNATMPIGLNTLRFDNTIGEPLYSNTKQIQYYNTALTDLELETLTSYTSFNEMALNFNYTI